MHLHAAHEYDKKNKLAKVFKKSAKAAKGEQRKKANIRRALRRKLMRVSPTFKAKPTLARTETKYAARRDLKQTAPSELSVN